MDRIQAVPCGRHGNYWDFSHFAGRDQPLVKRVHELPRGRQSERAAWKQDSTEKAIPDVAKLLDAINGELRDDRRCTGLSQSIETEGDPLEHSLGRYTVQQIVADVRDQRCRAKRRPAL